MPAIVSDAGTTIRTSVEDGWLTVGVFSESGIGNAKIALDEKSNDGLRLRLHVAGLEEFRLVYGDVEVVASVSSSRHDIRQYVAVDSGDGQPITPHSPYWLDIKVLDGDGEPAARIPTKDGYFQIMPPVDFNEGGFDVFSVAWIDFYR